MSAARRTLLTATAAGTLLGALWFVPSANATQEEPTQHASTSTAPDSTTTVTRASTESTGTDTTGAGTELADTGSVDTTPYVIGGTLFLGLGAGFITYSVRRERTAAY